MLLFIETQTEIGTIRRLLTRIEIEAMETAPNTTQIDTWAAMIADNLEQLRRKVEGMCNV